MRFAWMACLVALTFVPAAGAAEPAGVISISDDPDDTPALPAPVAPRPATPANDPPPVAPPAMKSPNGDAAAPAAQSPEDAALIAAGQAAFNASCTQCHDAARSTEVSKDVAGWRATVRRMAAKPDADIAASDIEPISRYLASLGGGAGGNGGATRAFDLNVTLSPRWLGGGHNLENGGFFPDTWLGAAWHPDNPLSARVLACATCHREGGQSHRIELVEAVVRLDVNRWLGWGTEGAQTAVEAGRFMVPFGSQATQAHPGSLRMVTRPLMYNMGENVQRRPIGPPLLPAPYSDEGVVVKSSVPVGCDLTATFDVYVVNGLQGDSDVDFYASRDYADNNNELASGGRVTIGNSLLRLGASAMTGVMNDELTAGLPVLNYELWGVDLTFRYEDLVRVQAEYAVRNSDRLLFLPDKLRDDEELEGFNLEGELLLSRCYGVSLTGRYDLLDRHSDLPPPGSSLPDGEFSLHRFTYGLNIQLPGGSVLLINHERWYLPEGFNPVDVAGLRWTATF